MIHKLGPDLLSPDSLSRQNYKEDKDEEIAGMQVNINATETATSILECMMIHVLQHEMALDSHLKQLKECIIKGWPKNKDNIPQNLRPHWTFQDDMAVTDRVILKGRHIMTPDTLQKQAVEQLHINHMEMEKKSSLHVNQYIGHVLILILRKI